MYQSGTTAGRPVLPVPGEVFALRKLLPAGAPYDFNIHVMDFLPGEFLNVKARLGCTENINKFVCIAEDPSHDIPACRGPAREGDLWPSRCRDSRKRTAISTARCCWMLIEGCTTRFLFVPVPRLQEVHYNQHGLVLLAGQGIYRLADRWCVSIAATGSWVDFPSPHLPGHARDNCGKQMLDLAHTTFLQESHNSSRSECLAVCSPWTLRLKAYRYPVQAGAAIWMAPYMPQWYLH